jgi:TP901 family phage tail tape measure protein
VFCQLSPDFTRWEVVEQEVIGGKTLGILLGDLVVKFTANVTGLTAGAAAAKAEMKAFGDTAKGLGLGVATGLVAGATAIVGFTAASTKMAGDFQQAMLLNVSHAGLLKSKMDETGQAILRMSTEVGRSPTAMAQALYPILSGFSSIQDQGAKAAISLATLKLPFQAVAGSEADGNVVARSAIGIFNSFGMATNNQAVNLQRMMGLFDMMNESVKQGNMQWTDYSRMIGVFSSKMAQAHVSITEGNAALDVFTNTGENAQLAGTHLGALFLKMAIDTETLAKHAKKLHESFDVTKFKAMDLAGKLAYLDDITGHDSGKIRAIIGNQAMTTTYLKLRDHMRDYQSALEAISHSHGSLAESFKVASSGFNAGMERMKSAVEALMITVGTALLPVLGKLLDKITPAITGFTNWITSGNRLQNVMNFVVGTVTNVSTVISNIVGFVQNLVAGIQRLTGFFQQNHDAAAALLIPLGLLGGAMTYLAVQGVVALIAAVPGMVAGFLAGAASAWTMAAGVIAATWPFLLIGAAIGAVIAIVIIAINHWGAITAWLKSAWGNISSWFMGLLSGIGNFFSNTWKGIQAALQASVNFLKNIVETGFNNIKDLVFKPINDIVGFFEWLYNHNYYFQHLVDKIKEIFTEAFKWLTDQWNKFTGWLGGIWNGIKDKAGQIWGSISSTISGKTQDAGNSIKTNFGHAKDTVDNWGYNIGKTVVTTFEFVAQVASKIWSRYLQPYLANAWQNIQNFFNGWPKTAFNWGVNLIQGFINGIGSMFGNVTSTVQNLMGNVASVLGFHSPTKEGPGKELDIWGPNMVKGFAAGIDKSAPLLRASMTHLVSPMGAFAVAAAGSGGGSSKQPIIITVEMDSTVIMRKVMTAADREVRLRLGANGRAA